MKSKKSEPVSAGSSSTRVPSPSSKRAPSHIPRRWPHRLQPTRSQDTRPAARCDWCGVARAPHQRRQPPPARTPLYPARTSCWSRPGRESDAPLGARASCALRKDRVGSATPGTGPWLLLVWWALTRREWRPGWRSVMDSWRMKKGGMFSEWKRRRGEEEEWEWRKNDG